MPDSLRKLVGGALLVVAIGSVVWNTVVLAI